MTDNASSTYAKDQLEAFFQWESACRDMILIRRCYVDLAGDLVGGVFLSQVIYWFLPQKSGTSRLTVEIDGILWLAKKREDWWHECRITLRQFDRLCSSLEKRGLIATKVAKFNGCPTKHIRVIWPAIMDALVKAMHSSPPWLLRSILPKEPNGSSPKGNMNVSGHSNIQPNSTLSFSLAKGEDDISTTTTAESTAESTKVLALSPSQKELIPEVPKRFQKPTLEELKLYGTKIGLPAVECEAFMDWYDSNGWKAGRNPMRDWPAAMRNWHRRWLANPPHRNGNGKEPYRPFAKEIQEENLILKRL